MRPCTVGETFFWCVEPKNNILRFYKTFHCFVKILTPSTHRRRFYYDQSVAENVADRDKSQEKRSGVFISAVGSS